MGNDKKNNLKLYERKETFEIWNETEIDYSISQADLYPRKTLIGANDRTLSVPMFEKIQDDFSGAFYFSPDSYFAFWGGFSCITVYAVECGNGTHQIGNSCALNVSLILIIILFVFVIVIAIGLCLLSKKGSSTNNSGKNPPSQTERQLTYALFIYQIL